MSKFVLKKIFNKYYDIGIKFGNGIHILWFRGTFSGKDYVINVACQDTGVIS